MTKKESRAADSKPDFARLPAVSKLLEGEAVAPLVEAFGAVLVTELLREQLKRLRAAMQQGRLEDGALQHEAIAAEGQRFAREHLHTQQVVRASDGEREGVGVLEQVVVGPYAPAGFESWFDGAKS